MSTMTYLVARADTEYRLERYRHSEAGRVGSLLRAARYRRAASGDGLV